MQLPFVSRKQHEKELDELRTRNAQLALKLSRCQKEHEELGKKFDEVLPKLARPTLIQPDQRTQNYRLVVEFSPEYIHQAFEHGGDSGLIEYTAQRLVHQIEADLRGMNFVRFEDFNRMQRPW